MRSYIEKRLENLIGEHANGQTAIRNLEAQLTAMRETVIRINGAITLCQEALRDAPKEEPQAAPVKLASVHPGTECGADLAAQREYTLGVPVKSCSGTQAGHNLERCDLTEGHNGDCKF